MIHFLQNFIDTVHTCPDRPAVIDRDGTRTTTYCELYTCAMRVNAWIRSQQLGREDVIAIYFPKSMEYVATRIGVIMAGAAWLALEDLMGKERMDYAIRDSGCKVVFDQAKWDEAMRQDIPIRDIPITDSDLHDLAFILYTSGSTGTPKGVMQEYGLYDYIMTTSNQLFLPYGKLNFAEVAPQIFISGVFSTISMMNCGGTLHEITPDMARDVARLTAYFTDHQITVSFLPPTLIRLFLDNPALSLRIVCTGGENAAEIYTDRFDIANVYSSSEIGYPACRLIIDRPYANTPAGDPTDVTECVLLDEKGRPADEGEFCIHLPYFRGYLHAQNDCFVTYHRKRYFRSSDYAIQDADGHYIILSRLDDMVKLNGNRVDTKEVEAVLKRVLQLDFCHVRLHVSNGIRMLCAWYTGDHPVDTVTAAETLHASLPEYMLPGIYVRLDHIPLNANGKLDVRSLPEPHPHHRLKPYAAPEDPLQEQLCNMLQQALELEEPVGIDDDFFALGGDSLTAMEALSAHDIPGLTMQMLYEGRTIRRITALLRESETAGHALQQESETAGHAHEQEPVKPIPLNTSALHLLRQDLQYPGTTMLNLPVKLFIHPDADLTRLAAAVRQAVKAHPVLLSGIVEQDGTWYLQYMPSFDHGIPVEDVLVGEQAGGQADGQVHAFDDFSDFVRPFTYDGAPLFRCRILRADDGPVLLLDVSHVICDGLSLAKLIGDIASSYAGEAPAPDHAFSLLRKEQRYRNSPRFWQDMAYFADRYDHPGWTTLPQADNETDTNTDGQLYRPFHFTPEETGRLKKKYGLGENGLYIAAAGLAMAAASGAEDIMFSWTWNGRADQAAADAVGMFIKDIPIAMHLRPGLRLPELFYEITSQIREGIPHGNASYWEEKQTYEGNDLLCLVYQGDLYESAGAAEADDQEATGIDDADGQEVINTGIAEFEARELFLNVEELPRGPRACDNALDIEILEGQEDFGILLDYNAAKYDPETMERFADNFCRICEAMIRHSSPRTSISDLLRGI